MRPTLALTPRQRPLPSPLPRRGPRAASSSTRRPEWARWRSSLRLVRDADPRRRLHPLGPGRAPAAGRARVGLLPGTRAVLVDRPGRPPRATARDRGRRSRHADRLRWGRASGDDARLTRIAAEAGRHALHVAVHLEPYHGRTPATVATDLLHLRAHGVTDVYVYDATHTPAAEWATVLTPVDGVRVFANTARRASPRPAVSTVSTPTTRTCTTGRRSRASVRRHGDWDSCAHRPSGRATTPAGRPATRGSASGAAAPATRCGAGRSRPARTSSP